MPPPARRSRLRLRLRESGQGREAQQGSHAEGARELAGHVMSFAQMFDYAGSAACSA